VQYYLHEKGEIFYWPPGPSFVIRYVATDEYLNIQHIGKVVSGVEQMAGIGNTDMTFELIDDTTALENTSVEQSQSAEVYNLQGQRVSNTDQLPKGVYIANGKKIMK